MIEQDSGFKTIKASIAKLNLKGGTMAPLSSFLYSKIKEYPDLQSNTFSGESFKVKEWIFKKLCFVNIGLVDPLQYLPEA